jgi:hypothetical protein
MADSRWPIAEKRLSSALWWGASPKDQIAAAQKSHQTCHGPVCKTEQHSRDVPRQVAPLGSNCEKALGLRRGSEGDACVTTEQGHGPQRVPLNEVDVDGNGCSPKLVDHGPRASGQRSVRGVEHADTELLRQLPAIERPVPLHGNRLGQIVGDSSTSLLRYGALDCIADRLSAIGYRLSAIGHQPSAVGYRLSAIGYPSSRRRSSRVSAASSRLARRPRSALPR